MRFLLAFVLLFTPGCTLGYFSTGEVLQLVATDIAMDLDEPRSSDTAEEPPAPDADAGVPKG